MLYGKELLPGGAIQYFLNFMLGYYTFTAALWDRMDLRPLGPPSSVRVLVVRGDHRRLEKGIVISCGLEWPQPIHF